MPEVLSHGMRISYDDHGRGEPALLCLPGWCGSRRIFEPLADRCATRRRVLALDWRGHGQSETPAADFGTSDLVEDALAALEPPAPVVHLYAQPEDRSYLAAQQAFGAAHRHWTPTRVLALGYFLLGPQLLTRLSALPPGCVD